MQGKVRVAIWKATEPQEPAQQFVVRGWQVASQSSTGGTCSLVAPLSLEHTLAGGVLGLQAVCWPKQCSTRSCLPPCSDKRIGLHPG